ncbi:Acyl transferase/acyl hydrolase/lysophospholipase [Penicillium expansum]|uniref:Acyl transferase/acyl hydrolase/lysophospholipase n=1 Tax=Penicillium expansum TaxID=27334 RepID=A0A0A2JBU8_PENEN|nr:Acyl transferase/acyl hydrolase/lysophospholipase [Penicillium expansum]KGO47180.1 Acyl transferase/acyl hydrolase/lysophospholipase [Penicillium expansum]KGO52266.1 Acyl transferase/acyl hydrolase/lysophospholipase [Penicillium expansum]KGO63457.1 Acyl transferase/acyl hydrolase/lysophospholipase [Penicillium expansum]
MVESSISTRPVCVLFGPQTSAIEESISIICNSLRTNPSLSFLKPVLEELPSLWSVITDAWPALLEVPGDTQLGTLAQAACGDSVESPEIPSSVLLTPVTVLRQIIEFCELKENHLEFRIVDAQGFCVGFLAAVAVSCSQNTHDFQEIASVMVRLAVCIGAAVDLDANAHGLARSMAVRWKSGAENKRLNQVLLASTTAYISCFTDTNAATITVADAEVEQIMKELRANGLSAKNDARFRLPNTNSSTDGPCVLPLRSNVDGDVIGKGSSIHDIALESILTKASLWSLTVSGSFDGTHQQFEEELGFVAIGTEQFVPRRIRNRLVKSAGSLGNTSNGQDTQPNGVSHTSIGAEVEQEKSQNTSKSPSTAVPIAITGMGCRYAQADSPDLLWELLQLGRCAVSPLPNKRFKLNELPRQPKGPFFGNYLENPDVFDHRFFNISAREAEAMDPQQRLLLQVAYESMESAGYCGIKKFSLPKDIGCYVGVGSDDYTDNVGSCNANAFSATGTLQAFNSGRVSHFFGWSGPSVVIDTACSSAAVAIHMACKALESNDCSIAVAGGVNVMTSPRVTQNLAAASFLSPTGASKAFDQNADGYCRGEGAGLVVLRPLEDALRNGDPILAIIGGSAVNQGSNCSPITVPNSESQRSLYCKAMTAAGVLPDQVTYVEAHGTGTQVGDPIEFDSLRKTFNGPTRKETLYVGSVKDNIGHVETASGVAGLQKVILMMQKSQITKQANFTRLNPNIPSLENELIDIPTRLTEWQSAAASKAVAMVTNYGAAGSNAAIVVKQHESSSQTSASSRNIPSEVPVIIAASSAESLRSYCKALISYVRDGNAESYIDTAYNLAVKQNRDLDYIHAFSVPSDDSSALILNLESLDLEPTMPKKKSRSHLPVILCFGGQNGNACHISMELFARNELIKYHLMECERVCQALGLPSLFPTIFDAAPNDDIVSLHCVLFAIQYSSAKSWLASGLKVDRIIGHSFGQLTGLCVSGGLELSDAIYLVSERARLIRDNWGPDHGIMLSVEASIAEVERLLGQSPEILLDIACVNGQRNMILAGDELSVQAFEKIAVQGPSTMRTRRLKNTHAFHSRLVDSIVPAFTQIARSIQYFPLSIPIEACSDGDWSSVTPADIVYHSRHRVDFQKAVERAASKAHGPAVWLEAGSASPVISMIRQVIEATASCSGDHVYQAIDLEGPVAQKKLSQATANLWNNGVSVQFWPFHDSQAKSYNWINLPPYQFAQNRHWIDYDPFAFAPPQGAPPASPADDLNVFIRVLSKELTECICAVNTNHPLYQMCTSGHAVVDQNLCPASLYIEMVVRAADFVRSDNSSSLAMPHVQNLDISAPLVLNPRGDLLLKLSRMRSDQTSWSFSLYTRDTDQSVIVHATGDISLYPFDSSVPIFARLNSMGRLIDSSRVQAIQSSPTSSGLKGIAVYQAFRRVVNYAECYRGVSCVYATEHESAGVVNLPLSPTHDSACDPVLMDNFIQVAGIHVNCLSDIRSQEVYVCTEIGEFLIAQAFVGRTGTSSETWDVYSNLDRTEKGVIVCDIFVLNRATGKLAVAILAVTFKSILITSLTRALKALDGQSEEPKVVDKNIPRDFNRKELDHVTLQSSPAPRQIAPARDHFVDVQAMLCDLLGMPADELHLSSNLEDIGVDSLMRTEVLAEIKKRFNVSISISSLTENLNIEALVGMIFPEASAASVTNQGPATSQVGAAHLASEGDGSLAVPYVPVQASQGLMDIAPEFFTEIQKSTAHATATKWDGFYRSVYPMQMELVTAYVVEAFQSLGVVLENLQPEQLVPRVEILPQHDQVMRQFYTILESSNLIMQAGAGFVRTHTSVSKVASSELHERILSLYPQHASEHKLLKTTGSQLADCLTGDSDPLALLFQDAEARELMGDVYTNAPMFNAATRHLSEYLAGVLGGLDTSREIRILEIGAGTGGTTKALLSTLTAVPNLRLKYTFTDLSSGLLALARKKFKEYNFMEYQVLNIEQDPSPGMLGQYDIIISSNCIHATRNLVKSSTNIRKLLRPDGILCLIELTRNLPWFDLVFGLLEGWWLFDDGRKHALATEDVWKESLSQSGFEWVNWSLNHTEESNTLRLITASPTPASPLVNSMDADTGVPKQETVVYGEKDGVRLCADIFYPESLEPAGRRRPIALMIHGGGHIMLSRRDIRPEQTNMLLDSGFLPVSIDYRLCPEVSLLDGPMLDAREALRWARCTLPKLKIKRLDIQPDGDQVVAVGWSTGGHLAMTLAWTAPQDDIAPPDAILAFYCPMDYEDPFWSKPNFPYGQKSSSVSTASVLLEGMRELPITAYNPSANKKALGGWMSPTDARSRIALHMNWTGQTLPVLLGGGQYFKSLKAGTGDEIPEPMTEDVQAVSPLAQIRRGTYKSPTFIIHGTLDDLIPVTQVRKTYDELVVQGVEAELRVLEKGLHLFDIYPGYKEDRDACQAVLEGYDFLRSHVRI